MWPADARGLDRSKACLAVEGRLRTVFAEPIDLAVRGAVPCSVNFDKKCLFNPSTPLVRNAYYRHLNSQPSRFAPAFVLFTKTSRGMDRLNIVSGSQNSSCADVPYCNF